MTNFTNIIDKANVPEDLKIEVIAAAQRAKDRMDLAYQTTRIIKNYADAKGWDFEHTLKRIFGKLPEVRTRTMTEEEQKLLSGSNRLTPADLPHTR